MGFTLYISDRAHSRRVDSEEASCHWQAVASELLPTNFFAMLVANSTGGE
jgi:hypothetical protein